MKALFYPSFGHLAVSSRPEPVLQEDEVLLRVAACGVCGSELESFRNQSLRRLPPRIMGHEFSGVIESVGNAVRDWKPGMKVVGNAVIPCGKCTRCKEGRTNLCESRQIFGMERDGAFADLVNVPERCLVSIPDPVSLRMACLAEPLANGVHMVRMTAHLPLKRILVIGAGPIGLMAQQAFQAMRGVATLVTDIKEDRLQAAVKLGAKQVFHAAEAPVKEKILALTEGEGIDLVVDAVGAAETGRQGLQLVRRGGTVILIGLHENSRSLASYDLILPEKQVIGSYAATTADIHTALELMAAGKADVSSWISYYPLDQGEEAFREMLEAGKDHIKSVILMQEGEQD
jgi:L-iditol 2-dehydrogenase